MTTKRIASIIVMLFCMVGYVCGEDGSSAPVTLQLKAKGRPVLSYHAGFQPSPDAAAPWYGRSGFIHPFLTPAGKTVTEGFPADHMHQHGLMFAWTSAIIDGKKVDFWNSHQKQGHVEHLKTVSATDKRIVVNLRHMNDRTEPPSLVLNETWELTQVDDSDYHIADLLSVQRCRLDKPLKIAKYHYGAMCIRGSSRWLKSAGMTTSQGKTRLDGNHTRPRWVAMFGEPADDCGIVAMSHPENARSPQHVRLHPKMPYFCFLPMVEGDLEIKPQEPFVSRYRFVAFDGQLDREKIEAIWKQFAALKTEKPN